MVCTHFMLFHNNNLFIVLITTEIECLVWWPTNNKNTKEGLVIEHKFPQQKCDIICLKKNEKLEQA